MSSSTGRRRATERQYSAEEQALDQISKEAEERIQARRQARAEAREIRMREIERQQKEEEERLKAPQQGIPESTKVGSNYSGSRRGSDDSTDTDVSSKDSRDPKDHVRELRNQLRGLEEKYKQAMVTNAQLDNVKTTHVFELEILKEKLEEQEEAMIEVQRQYKDKCKDYESQKRDFNNLQLDCEALKSQMSLKDRLLEESGLVVISNEEGEFSLSRCSDKTDIALSTTGASLISEESADLLRRAGEGTLGKVVADRVTVPGVSAIEAGESVNNVVQTETLKEDDNNNVDSGMVNDRNPKRGELISDQLNLSGEEIPNRLDISGEITSNEIIIAQEAAPDKLAVSEEMPSNKLVVSGEVTSDKLACSEQIVSDKLIVSEKIVSDVLGVSEETVSDKLSGSEALVTDKLGDSEEVASDNIGISNKLGSSEEVVMDMLGGSEEIVSDYLGVSGEVNSQNVLLEKHHADDMGNGSNVDPLKTVDSLDDMFVDAVAASDDVSLSNVHECANKDDRSVDTKTDAVDNIADDSGVVGKSSKEGSLEDLDVDFVEQTDMIDIYEQSLTVDESSVVMKSSPDTGVRDKDASGFLNTDSESEADKSQSVRSEFENNTENIHETTDFLEHPGICIVVQSVEESNENDVEGESVGVSESGLVLGDEYRSMVSISHESDVTYHRDSEDDIFFDSVTDLELDSISEGIENEQDGVSNGQGMSEKQDESLREIANFCVEFAIQAALDHVSSSSSLAHGHWPKDGENLSEKDNTEAIESRNAMDNKEATERGNEKEDTRTIESGNAKEDAEAIESGNVVDNTDATESGNEKDDTRTIESGNAKEDAEAIESGNANEDAEAVESGNAVDNTEATESGNAKEDTEAIESGNANEDAEAVESGNAKEDTRTVESGNAKEGTEATDSGNTKEDTRTIESGNTKEDTRTIESGNTKEDTRTIESGNAKEDTEATESGNAKEHTEAIGSGNAKEDTTAIGSGNAKEDTEATESGNEKEEKEAIQIGNVDTEIIGNPKDHGNIDENITEIANDGTQESFVDMNQGKCDAEVVNERQLDDGDIETARVLIDEGENDDLKELAHNDNGQVSVKDPFGKSEDHSVPAYARHYSQDVDDMVPYLKESVKSGSIEILSPSTYLDSASSDEAVEFFSFKVKTDIMTMVSMDESCDASKTPETITSPVSGYGVCFSGDSPDINPTMIAETMERNSELSDKGNEHSLSFSDTDTVQITHFSNEADQAHFDLPVFCESEETDDSLSKACTDILEEKLATSDINVGDTVQCAGDARHEDELNIMDRGEIVDTHIDGGNSCMETEVHLDSGEMAVDDQEISPETNLNVDVESKDVSSNIAMKELDSGQKKDAEHFDDSEKLPVNDNHIHTEKDNDLDGGDNEVSIILENSEKSSESAQTAIDSGKKSEEIETHFENFESEVFPMEESEEIFLKYEMKQYDFTEKENSKSPEKNVEPIVDDLTRVTKEDKNAGHMIVESDEHASAIDTGIMKELCENEMAGTKLLQEEEQSLTVNRNNERDTETEEIVQKADDDMEYKVDHITVTNIADKETKSSEDETTIKQEVNDAGDGSGEMVVNVEASGEETVAKMAQEVVTDTSDEAIKKEHGEHELPVINEDESECGKIKENVSDDIDSDDSTEVTMEDLFGDEDGVESDFSGREGASGGVPDAEASSGTGDADSLSAKDDLSLPGDVKSSRESIHKRRESKKESVRKKKKGSKDENCCLS